ncbi:MAG: M28 family metallopeptidase [Candidatus Aminicenantes bacterium]
MKNKGIIISGIIFLFLSFSVFSGKSETSEKRIEGFTLQNSKKQRQIENKFKLLPQPDNCMKYSRYLTEEPHMAGTEENYELARYVRDKFEEFGLDEAELVEYKVLLSYPQEIEVEMVEPEHFKASLREEGYFRDKDSYDSGVSVGFNAYSASGEVTAPLVYAHGGNPEDYDRLLDMGIDVKGKIAIVRYSMPYSYRGFKALTAQKRGAAALLIYSDPMDDGYMRGEVYPYGPWGPESHIQRGGIPFDFIVPGDPLTPGWASVEGARRIKPEESRILPEIISVPLSHKDAGPLLENLQGPVAPHGWQGGLPFTYHVGPGPTKVRLSVKMEEPIKSIWNVVGRIKGSDRPEEWVVIGNHRDAWVYGAVDPNSGTSSMLELARGLGKMAEEGYRPRRSVVFCSWDAEEYTLTGSTEWAEQWAEKLKKDGVVYINVDSACSGPNFHATSMPSLKDLLPSVAQEVTDPNTGSTVYDVWKKRVEKGQGSWLREREEKEIELTNTRVGSGSDHTAFINFICMPIINMGFSGPYGVYHSQYDNFYWMSHFGDPQFRYHATMSKIWGMAVLRLANADILPFDYAFYAEEISNYIKEMDHRIKESLTPDINSLLEAVDEFRANAQELNKNINGIITSEGPLSDQSVDIINSSLMEVERCFGHGQGIPDRPWFKHLIYAPEYTYAAQVLPGINEAIRNEDWKRAGQQISILRKAIERANDVLIRTLNQIE